MTVNKQQYRATVTYNPVSDHVYQVPFRFLEEGAYLKVYLRLKDGSMKPLKLDTDYTVTNSPGHNNMWGKVKLIDPMLFRTVTISRAIPNSQEKIFTSHTILATNLERALDKLTMLAQDNEFKEMVIHAPDDDVLTMADGSSMLQLPSAVDRANKYAMFGQVGQIETGFDEISNSLRQPAGEAADSSFVLPLADERAGKIIAFDDAGHVAMEPIDEYFNRDLEYVDNIKAGENINISNDRVISATYKGGFGIEIDNRTSTISSTLKADGKTIVVDEDTGEIRGNYQDGTSVHIDGNIINNTVAYGGYQTYNASLLVNGWESSGEGGGLMNLSLNANVTTEGTQIPMLLCAETVGNFVIAAGGVTGTDGFGNVKSTAALDSVTLLEVDRTGVLRIYPRSTSVTANTMDRANHNFTLSQRRGDMASVTLGPYVIFAGGNGSGSGSGNDRDNIDIFRLRPDGRAIEKYEHEFKLSEPKCRFAATVLGRFAIFAGGYRSTSGANERDSVDVFYLEDDNSLTKVPYNKDATLGDSEPVPFASPYEHNLVLGQARSDLGAATVATSSDMGYAIFAGGGPGTSKNSSHVDIFSLNTSGSFPVIRKDSRSLSLATARSHMGCVSAKGFCAFVGGHTFSGSNSAVTTIDIYEINSDGELAVVNHGLSLEKAIGRITGSWVNGKAIFFGGMDFSTVLSTPQAQGGFNVLTYDGGVYKLHRYTEFEKAEVPIYSSASTSVGGMMVILGGDTGGRAAPTIKAYRDSQRSIQMVKVDVPGLKETDVAVVDVKVSLDVDEALAQAAEWQKVIRVETVGEDRIIAHTGLQTPIIDLNIQLKV